jgi:hypothetical protein
MMLTELYYYYGNHQSAKVGSAPAFIFSPHVDKALFITPVSTSWVEEVQ